MSFKSILGAICTSQRITIDRIQQILWWALLTGFLGAANAADFTVNQTFDGADAAPGDGICATAGGNCTLRAAVMESNALAGADSISIPAGTYSLILGNTGEDAAAEGDLDILDDLTITGADAATTIINGNSFQYRIFSILKRVDDSLPVVTISKLTLTQGVSDVDGALIYNAGELTLDDVTLTDASLDSRAMVNDGNFLMSNSRVSGNAKGIYNRAGDSSITTSIFSNNVDTTGGDGAAIEYSSGKATITDTQFSDNEANFGGAISGISDSFIVSNCTFNRNKANYHPTGSSGGALSIRSYRVIIKNSTFTANAATRDGGALVIYGTFNSIVDSTFVNNVAAASGGGIYGSGVESLRISRVTLSGNQTTDRDGGGIYLAGVNQLKFSESIITNNSAGNLGGGVFLLSGSSDSIVLTNLEVSNNTAVSGGGLFVQNGGGITDTVNIDNTSIANNIATGTSGGGGFYNKLGFFAEGLTELVHVTIANNTSPNGTGSNLANELGIVRLQNTLIAYPVGDTNCSGSITTLGYNLSSDASCGLGVEGDQSNTDPLLDVLADNGGFNKTLALKVGSPAIDAGSSVLCVNLNPLDQRYFYRGDTACDIGAYESGSIRAQSGILAISAADISVNEGDGTATVTFSRTGGSEGVVSIPYFDDELGTAKADDIPAPGAAYFPFDYGRIATVVLEWADGDSSDKTLEIVIWDDSTSELDESFFLELDAFAFGGASLGLSAATVTIIDNDVPGEIQFNSSGYTVAENGTFASIVVERINGSTAVSIDYATSNGTAVAGTDYDASSGTLNFSVGETSKTFSVDITNNVLTDGNRTVNLALSNPQGGLTLGAPVTAVLTIEDDESGGGTGGAGELQFASAEVTVNETDGTATITISRTNGSTGTVSVDYFANPTSVIPATLGSDYILPDGTLTFADGVTSQTITLTIVDDSLLEGDEDFWVDLDSPTGGAILGTDWYTLVTIIDDETGSGGGGGAACRAYTRAGELQFDSDTMSVNEDAGSVTVTVNRAFGCEGTVGVDFNVAFPLFTGIASASKGSDFNLADGTLTFADGVTSQTITFSVINDAVSEDDEAFIIDLEFPTGGVSFGMDSELTVTITDDDSGSGTGNSGGSGSGTNNNAEPDSSGGGGGAMNPLLLLGLLLVPVIRRRKKH